MKSEALLAAFSAFAVVAVAACSGRPVPTAPTPAATLTAPPAPPAPGATDPAPAIQTWTIAGVVTESAPSEQTPIGGARIEVVEGSRPDARATSDGNGYYSIPALSGGATLFVSREGYEPRRLIVPSLTRDTRVDTTLVPVLRSIEDVFDDCILANGRAIGHIVAIHHAGTLRADANWYGTSTFFRMEVWKDGTRLAETDARPARDLRLSVPVQPGRYEVRMNGERDLHYRLRVTRPS